MVKPVLVGWNAKSGFPVPDNDIQIRAVGRALAHNREWEILDEPKSLANGKVLKFSMKHKTTGEERHILSYKMVAKEGRPYLLTLNENGTLEWAKGFKSGQPLTIPRMMADDETYRMYTVMVRRVDENGQLGNLEMSKSTWSGQFVGRHVRQQKLGINPNDPRYVHPLAFIPKDMWIAFFANKKQAHIKTRNASHARSILREFCAAEKDVIAGVPYEPQD